MSFERQSWFWALAVLAAACTQDPEPEGSTCPPFCTTPGPVQTGDSGAPPSSGVPDAGATPPGRFPPPNTGGTPDSGGIRPIVEAGIAPVDSGLPVADAQTDASTFGEGGAPAPAGDGGTGSPLPPVTDYTKPGPFKSTTQANVGPDRNYTIFRPTTLGENGFVHPIITFGPGILTSPSFYTDLLGHFATHGFVTICVNSLWGGPGAADNVNAMKTGLDWMIMQNSAAGMYQGKLDVNRAVAMGYSLGATASVQLSSHKAIATTVVIHGHSTMGDPHGPVLMITGTSDVIDDMRRTLGTLMEAPAVLVALPIGHLDVLTEVSSGGRYIPTITAWLRYWLNGDQGGKSTFYGDGCTMCKSPWITPEPNQKWKDLKL